MTDIDSIKPDTARERIRDIFGSSRKLRGYALDDTSTNALGAYLAARQAALDQNLDVSETRAHFEKELGVYAPTILRLMAA